VTRSFFLSALFGTLVSLVAVHVGSTAGSPIQAVLVGILSALGFLTASVMMRGRLRRRQGDAPAMLQGEEARLYGPGELIDAGGRAKVWIYVSNMRLLVRAEDGARLDLPLGEIDELRPPRPGFLSGELYLVAKGRGLFTLKVPDARRWHAAIHGAIHRD
jgi:hypothetical protein